MNETFEAENIIGELGVVRNDELRNWKAWRHAWKPEFKIWKHEIVNMFLEPKNVGVSWELDYMIMEFRNVTSNFLFWQILWAIQLHKGYQLGMRLRKIKD